uniref:ORF1 n=1 Tax=Leptolyngbya foveolarum TaxID=47253 RepID=Q51767_9CYAN|nr:ORF1 [Leptolyngbya foveolarum]
MKELVKLPCTCTLSWSDGIVEELGAIVLDSWKKCGVNAAKLPSGMLLSQTRELLAELLIVELRVNLTEMETLLVIQAAMQIAMEMLMGIYIRK